MHWASLWYHPVKMNFVRKLAWNSWNLQFCSFEKESLTRFIDSKKLALKTTSKDQANPPKWCSSVCRYAGIEWGRQTKFEILEFLCVYLNIRCPAFSHVCWLFLRFHGFSVVSPCFFGSPWFFAFFARFLQRVCCLMFCSFANLLSISLVSMDLQGFLSHADFTFLDFMFLRCPLIFPHLISCWVSLYSPINVLLFSE